ncbi:MAG: hypothetical protein FGF53_06460, partial [Candidatus Brockarchaeota archaeon]|nr:hypothetical protein [Candidatus Brockarchaeota archaeon]
MKKDYTVMLQRCHICGRADENCRPCEYCGWWFCEKHIDPEQHECTGLKIPRQPSIQRGGKVFPSLKRSPFLGLGLLF